MDYLKTEFVSPVKFIILTMFHLHILQVGGNGWTREQIRRQPPRVSPSSSLQNGDTTNSTEHSSPWELTGTQLAKEFPIFKGTKCSLSCLPLVCYLSQVNPVHTHTPYFFNISYNILPSKPGFSTSLFPLGFTNEILHQFPTSHELHHLFDWKYLYKRTKYKDFSNAELHTVVGKLKLHAQPSR